VQALAFIADGQAQVSMNLTDLDRTPLIHAFDAVRNAADRIGAPVTSSEVVGLVPQREIPPGGVSRLQLGRFSEAQTLERRLQEEVPEFRPVGAVLTELAAPTVAPAGEFATAYAAAFAASLVRMVAGLSIRRNAKAAETLAGVPDEAARLATRLLLLADADTRAYRKFAAAQNSPDAALAATEVPLQVARAALRVLELAVAVSEVCSPAAIPDCAIAAMLCYTACAGSEMNVRGNVHALAEHAEAGKLLAESANLSARASRLAAEIQVSAKPTE
jgi:glutamate formiminotransferase/formiminotetrahydrofolate cyclodeaminase